MCLGIIITLAALVIVYFIYKRYLSTLTVTEFNRKYVLITGCDTGFGNNLAKQLDELGFHVFAGCLTKEGISELHKCCTQQLEAFLLDVTKTTDIIKAEQFVRSKLPKDTGLWALVNNAGVMGTYLFPDCLTREHYEEVMNVNVYGMIDVTTTFLPLLRMAKGRIVNISSIFGKISPFTAIAYCISKHAVEAYSNGLRCGLREQNVSVHIIQPGAFATNLTAFEPLKQKAIKAFEAAPIQVQQYYGKNFFDNFLSKLSLYIEKMCDKKIQRVVSSDIHAVTAKYPEYRYTPGCDSTFVIPILRMLPVRLSDKLIHNTSEQPIGVAKSI